jgi:hypothetical protein
MKTKPMIFAIAATCLILVGLTGCVSTIRSAGSVLTTKENFQMGRLIGQNTFSLQDVICFHVDITWDNVSQDVGWSDIEWNWYKDGKLVAHYENDRAYLQGAPNGRTKMQPASGLGVGHFKAECEVDGKPIASAEFDIQGNPST